MPENNCKYRPVERAGLYIMVFFILLHTCDISADHGKVMDELGDMGKKVEKLLDRVPDIFPE